MNLRFLGIPFWDGNTRDLLRAADGRGGLFTVPSAPSLAQMRTDPLLMEAYQSSDFAVVDGGYVALVLRFCLGRRLPRISGLQILEKLVGPDRGCAIPFDQRKVLWVVPSEEERVRIQSYLSRQGFSEERQAWYLAPFYRTGEDLNDAALIEKVAAVKPDWIVLCIAGGKQEKLGYFLRSNGKSPAIGGRCGGPGDTTHLSIPGRPNGPVILCTGGAISFLSGGQASIPVWADRLYLGWLFRICQSPKTFLPRYWNAGWEFPRLLWERRRGLFTGPPEALVDERQG